MHWINLSVSVEAKYWVYWLRLDVSITEREDELSKPTLNSSFCVVTADSKSKWPNGRKAAYFRAVRDRAWCSCATCGSSFCFVCRCCEYCCIRLPCGSVFLFLFSLPHFSRFPVLLPYQATNYVLSHQQEDSAGELETKLYKVNSVPLQSRPIAQCVAWMYRDQSHYRPYLLTILLPQGDVYKTAGGGHAVQFTEVETLKTRQQVLSSPERYARAATPPSRCLVRVFTARLRSSGVLVKSVAAGRKD